MPHSLGHFRRFLVFFSKKKGGIISSSLHKIRCMSDYKCVHKTNSYTDHLFACRLIIQWHLIKVRSARFFFIYIFFNVWFLGFLLCFHLLKLLRIVIVACVSPHTGVKANVLGGPICPAAVELTKYSYISKIGNIITEWREITGQAQHTVSAILPQLF